MAKDLRSTARLPGFVSFADAINRIGPTLCPDWDGTERTAPRPAELLHDLGTIRDMPHKQLMDEDARDRASIYEEAERQRAAGAQQSGTPEGIPRLRAQIADPATPENLRAGMRKTLARLVEMIQAPPQPDRNTRRIGQRRAERTRHRLADELYAAHEPGDAARIRWAKVHAALCDKVLAGALRMFARLPDGELRCPTASEWRGCFPALRASRAYLPSLGGKIPATVFFEAAELDRVFQAEQSRLEQPGKPSESAPAPIDGREFSATGDKKRRGRSAAQYWSEIEPQVMEWLDNEGAPSLPGDLARFEKFIADRVAGKGHSPAESTIRGHAKDLIAKFEETRHNH